MLREKTEQTMRDEVRDAIYAALKRRAAATAAEAIDKMEETSDLKRPHICPACGFMFKSKVALYTHKYENLWEDYLTERLRHSRPYLCTFCGDDFLTKDDFLQHWYFEGDHEDYALTFLQMGQTKKADPHAEWLISPTEEILLERRIRYDSEMKAVKKKKSAGTWIHDTIAYRIHNNEMIVAECWGIPGSGKSHSILSLIYTHAIPESYKRLARDWIEKSDENYAVALIYRDEQRADGRDIGIGRAAIELMKRRKIWREPTVHITFSVAETLKAIREANELDVIMQDEDPGLMGRGSESAKMKIQTILKLMRKKRISFFFVSPVRIQYITTSNLAFEVTHKKNPLTARVTRGILYDREHVALGWYQHKILEKQEKQLNVRVFNLAARANKTAMLDYLDAETTDLILSGLGVELPVLTIYEILKDTNLDKIHYQMGAEGVEINWVQVDEDVSKVFDGLIERSMRTQPTKSAALRMMGEMSTAKIVRRIPAFGVKGEGDYQTLVAEETAERIQKELTEEYMGREFPDGRADTTSGQASDEHPLERDVTPSVFSLDDLDYMPYVEQETRLGKFKIDSKYVDAYRRWKLKEIDYKDQAAVAASLGMSSPGNISEQFGRITGRISHLRGGLFEIEMLKQYVASGMTLSMDPLPDLRYPEGMAPEGVPDRKIVLLNGKIRLSAWKCYDGNNPTVELGRHRERHGEKVFVYCPEIVEARRMIEMGANPDMVEVVMEGIMGRRVKSPDGGFMIVPEFFQVRVDPFTDNHSVTISKRGRVPYPPTVEQLTGIKPREKEEEIKDEEESSTTVPDV